MKLFKTLLVASLVTILGSCGSTRSTSCVQPGKCSKTKTYRVKSHSSNKSYILVGCMLYAQKEEVVLTKEDINY